MLEERCSPAKAHRHADERTDRVVDRQRVADRGKGRSDVDLIETTPARASNDQSTDEVAHRAHQTRGCEDQSRLRLRREQPGQESREETADDCRRDRLST